MSPALMRFPRVPHAFPRLALSASLYTAFAAAPLETQAAIANPASESGARPLSFERDVRPILKQHCVHCHGEGETLKAGLDVRLRRFLVSPRGKSQDIAVVPGDPKQSLLLDMVKSGEMPEKGKKLTASEVEVLEKWIAQGAVTARAEPEQVPRVWITEEDREFWEIVRAHD